METADADLSSMQVETEERTFDERPIDTFSSPLENGATARLAAVAPTGTSVATGGTPVPDALLPVVGGTPVPPVPVPVSCANNSDGTPSYRIKLAWDKETRSYYNANKNGGRVYKVAQEVMPELNQNIPPQPFTGLDIGGMQLPRISYAFYRLSAYLRSVVNVGLLQLSFAPSWQMQRIGTIHDVPHAHVHFNSSYFPTIDSVYNVSFFYVKGGARIGALKNISYAFLLDDSIPRSVDHVTTLSVSELTISKMIEKGAGEFCGHTVRVLPPTEYRLCGLYRGGTDQATNMVASPNPQWSIPNNVNACRMYCDNSGPQPGDQCISRTTVLKTYR